MLLKEPEPAPVVLDAQIESIRVLPDTLRRVTPEAAPEFAKTLPPDPGGRPQNLNEEESRYVYDEIGKLLARGVSLLDAQGRLSQFLAQGALLQLRHIRASQRDRHHCLVRLRVVSFWCGLPDPGDVQALRGTDSGFERPAAHRSYASRPVATERRCHSLWERARVWWRLNVRLASRKLFQPFVASSLTFDNW